MSLARSSAIGIASVAVGLTVVLWISQRTVSAQSGKDRSVGIESLPCAYNFTSGAGTNLFKWCLTSNGNIGSIESPPGYQHVYTEGYAVCRPEIAVNYWDFGTSASGFGPATIVSGCTTGSSCTLRRDTLDGRFRLKMAFTQNKPEKEINIVHTLTNLSTTGVANVLVARVADLDMDNSSGHDQSGAVGQSVWMYESRARMSLTGLTFLGLQALWVSGHNLSQDPCGYVSSGLDDFAMGISYVATKIGSQRSKSFKFQYRRD